MSVPKAIAAGLCGLLLLPVLVLSAFAGGFGGGSTTSGGSPSGEIPVGDLPELQQAVLSDPAIQFTPAARGDVESGLVDPRILQVLLILAQSHELAPVGPLISGHTHFVKGTTRVSNHVSGRAVDILGVDGSPVTPWNEAARDLMREALSLPAPLTPDEVGGPWIVQASGRSSFSDGNHQDHVHIGLSGTAS